MTTSQNLSIAANTTTANLVAGQMFEFLNSRTKMVLGACASAVGINHTLIVGGRVLINDQPMSQANRFPQLPEDVAAIEVCGPGRIVYTQRNTTGGALTTNSFIDLT
jgi:hypothetical protein